jgi:hypothetical protein
VTTDPTTRTCQHCGEPYVSRMEPYLDMSYGFCRPLCKVLRRHGVSLLPTKFGWAA